MTVVSESSAGSAGRLNPSAEVRREQVQRRLLVQGDA